MRLKLFFDQPIAQVILHDPYETPLGLPYPMETPTDHHKFGASPHLWPSALVVGISRPTSNEPREKKTQKFPILYLVGESEILAHYNPVLTG